MRVLLTLILAATGLHADALRFIPLWPQLKFDRPVALVSDTAQPQRLFVVEQPGEIWAVEDGKRTLLLDIRPKVRTENNEEGLLGLAFRPKDVMHRYYAIYSVKGAKPRKTRLSMFQGTPVHETTILEIEKPWGNHNGSTLLFGPDGFLYVSLGDGGSGGDPHGNAQNLGSLLGKVLRLDVAHPGADRMYSIPQDNPFVGQSGARGEVWAYGLRNPWRMAFDAGTGNLWAGDVGQDAREEVDIVRKGGNYGWNWREGSQAYKKGGPDAAQFVEPVFDYGRDMGFCITGGGVGRGSAPRPLLGRYVFADFGSRKVWSLDAAHPAASLREEGQAPDAVSSFGTDAKGGMYLVGYSGGVYKIE